MRLLQQDKAIKMLIQLRIVLQMNIRHHELICESLKEYVARSRALDKNSYQDDEFTLDIDFKN